MSVSATDFHEFAVRIADSDKEIDLRNAISRIYYAAYHDCLPKSVAADQRLDPRIGHAEFTDWLQGHGQGTPTERLASR